MRPSPKPAATVFCSTSCSACGRPARAHFLSAWATYFEHPVSWQAAIQEHQQVLDAIEAGDASAARKAMQKHLKQAHRRYSASWRRAPAR